MIFHKPFRLSLCVLCVLRGHSLADPLPGTKPLTEPGDLAAQMVAGIHAYLDRELVASVERRSQLWPKDDQPAEDFEKAIRPNRERLKKILGVVDPRLPPQLEYVGGPDEPHVVAETGRFTALAVRWAALPGVDGEGLLLKPKGEVVADVVAIPDADQTPEQLVGLAPGVADEFRIPARLAEAGCRVIVPVLIDRKDDFSGNPKLNKWTNQPHREFVHRMAFEMGRTLVGYEVQKVLAAVDWLSRTRDKDTKPGVRIWGYGEGSHVAKFAAMIHPQLRTVVLAGGAEDQAFLSSLPIDRNVWGLFPEFFEFHDAHPAPLLHGKHLLTCVAPRAQFAGPPPPRPGRSGAAPGGTTNTYLRPALLAHHLEQEPRPLPPKNGPRHTVIDYNKWKEPRGSEEQISVLGGRPDSGAAPKLFDRRITFSPAARQKRQFDQLVAYTQKLWRDSDRVRRAFWAKADPSSPGAWERSCDWYRDYLHTEVIGKLPESKAPLNPRTRRVYDEPTWAGYEVMLDVYPNVFASGILLLPKDQTPGERRPVVVCQHGLEGTPRSCIDPEKRVVYNQFARKLVERGYVVYCPQNPYIGGNTFRQINRKANPLKLSLFSFIVAQHRRTLDWLETLPQVDPKRIAFYGLSYGGKTAMRVPAVEKRYCLSICSGDFNEWVGKVVSVDLPMSYMFTGEYEMPEFDLGHTFNYAELAYLIAPRPFMVERGHDDGVGTDEMVAGEYAKVRYLYANKLKLADRTAIEFFPGGHQIHGVGTFAFLQRHLGFPK